MARSRSRDTVGTLVASINDAASGATSLINTSLLAALIVAALLMSASDESMLYDQAILLPQVGVSVSISAAYFIGAVAVVLLHFQCLTHIAQLNRQLTRLRELVPDATRRARLFDYLHPLFVVHFMADTGQPYRVQRITVIRFFMTWMVIVFVPLTCLFAIEIGFLRFQHPAITRIQQFLLLLDGLIVAWPSIQKLPSGRPPLAQAAALSAASETKPESANDRGPAPFKAAKPPRSNIMIWTWRAITIPYATALVGFALLYGNIADAALHPDVVRWRVNCLVDTYAEDPGGLSEGSAATKRMGLDVGEMRLKLDHACHQGSMFEQKTPNLEHALYAASVMNAHEASWLIWLTPLMVHPSLNPLDYLFCPRLGWGCRYLQLDHKTLFRGDSPLNVQDELADDLLRNDSEVSVGLAKTRDRYQLAGLPLRMRNLRFADFEGSVLYGVDLRGADLRGAILDDAVLPWARLERAALVGASLWNVDLSHAALPGVEGRGLDAAGANFIGAKLHDANLQRSNLRNAKLQGASLLSTNLDGSDLTEADLQGADLSFTSLEGTVLVDAQLQGAQLWGTHLQGADASGADLSATYMLGADLRASDFSGAVLAGVQVLEADMSESRWSSACVTAALFDGVTEWTGVDFRVRQSCVWSATESEDVLNGIKGQEWFGQLPKSAVDRILENFANRSQSTAAVTTGPDSGEVVPDGELLPRDVDPLSIENAETRWADTMKALACQNSDIMERLMSGVTAAVAPDSTFARYAMAPTPANRKLIEALQSVGASSDCAAMVAVNSDHREQLDGFLQLPETNIGPSQEAEPNTLTDGEAGLSPAAGSGTAHGHAN